MASPHERRGRACGRPSVEGFDRWYNFVEIEEWGLDRQEFLRRFLPYEKGVASHDTLNDVMNALDGAVFSACFTTWVEALRDGEPDIVAIDGKTKIAQAILDKEADYLLAIKENWPSLHGEIERCFNDALDGDLDRFETTDGDHGRIEIRRHAVSRDVAWLSSDRRFPGEPRFPGLAAIAMVETEVERGGKTSRERRYFLSSAPLDARFFARAVRCHWHVENRLHWVMDVVFHDDLSRLRSGCGPNNMAIVKHMAMNLVRNAPGKQSLTVRRKKASWNVDCLETIIRQRA